MKRASDAASFAADPVGSYVAGATHLVWCHSPTLCGSTHWGRPTERDARELCRALELAHHPALASGFDVLMDDRSLELVDWGAFRLLSDYVKAQLPAWGRVIRHQAVLVPPGPMGFVLAGLVPLLGMTFPLRFFSQRGEAFEWLARAEVPAVVDDAEKLADEVRGVPRALRALRQYLDGALVDATLEGAASAVGASPRGLQRELRRAHTRFSHELTQARLRAATLLLEHSDDKIEAIARTVGCVSSSQLSAMFREAVGETPARYRERLRARAAEQLGK